MAARLRAEVDGGELVFPAQVLEEPDLVKSETALYKSRRNSLEKSLKGINEALALVDKELKLTTRLAEIGDDVRAEGVQRAGRTRPCAASPATGSRRPP